MKPAFEKKNLFNQNTKLARNQWLAGCMKYQSKLSLWQPKVTSLATASGFDRILWRVKNAVDENKITSARIFIMDEKI
jgi:hypothetical protein